MKYPILTATQKWQNLTDFVSLKYCNVHYAEHQILLFLQSQKYNFFRVEILHVGRIEYCQHLGYFSYFLQSLKCSFSICQKESPWCLAPKKGEKHIC
jgi:hypothetical protein